MKTKKLSSLLLALMMMLSVVPMYASAAEPIALTEANVTVWPSYDGEMYFGQTIGEAFTVVGGEVKHNDTIVPGKFEILYPEYAPSSDGMDFANFKFIPDDTNMYIGFDVEFAWDVIYTINLAKPVFVDEINDPIVATDVEQGETLAKSTISGGQCMNPYNKEETNILAKKWEWTNKNAIVSKSGYYEAYLQCASYEKITAQVYVKVAGEATPITITEAPTVEAMTYDANRTYADITFVGGKAVDAVTGEEVAGTFAFTNTALNATVPSVGTRELEVTFTPNDTENYLKNTTTVTVTVNPIKIAFINEAGTETIPEITVPYGLKMSDDIGNYLKSYLNTSASFNFTETQYYNEYIPVGTHDLTVKASCSNANYESEAVLPFKLTVEPMETAVTVKYDINKDNKNTYEIYVVKADVDGARPQGNFAIYVDGQLLKDGAKYSEHITWSPEKSKAYTVKVVYTPTANDPCLVADTEITVDAKLYRNITTVNTSSDGTKQFRCGEKIQVAANVPEFSGWVITDAAGNSVDLGVDLSAKSIELAVPDYDITIEAKGKTSSGSDGLGNIFDMDFGDLSEGDSEWAIINIIRNLIAKFKSFLQQLIETFQSIGS